MADKKERMQVSWRLDYLSEDERKKINTWLDQQSNNQKSITNVVLHAIDRFGNADIMGHEIQRKLFNETDTLEDKPTIPNESTIVQQTTENETTEKDDWFEDIDENNL